MTLALPALDQALPGEAERLAKGNTPRWSFGGGTALALRLGHRVSDDVDVFVSGIALAELNSARNATAKAVLCDRIRSISWFEPGSKRGTVRFGWDEIADEEVERRLAAMDVRPLEAKEQLLEQWRMTSPEAFASWEDSGRPPAAATGPGARQKLVGKASERE